MSRDDKNRNQNPTRKSAGVYALSHIFQQNTNCFVQAF